MYVAKEAFLRREDYEVIHACDMDAALPALIMAKVLGKRIIFDVFDWMSSDSEKGFVFRIVEWLQNLCYKYSDAVILCEEERKAQAREKNNTILVIPNIPQNQNKLDFETLISVEKDKDKFDLVICYVGVFDRDRGIENLLRAVAKIPHIKLNIAGFGFLEDVVQQYSTQYKNISYWGRVEYSVGQAIQKNADLIAAMYHLSNPVHKFAAPNKYYESLALGVPIVTTDNTLVGDKTLKYDTGFVIDESLESLLALLEQKKLKEQIKKKQSNCVNTWNSIYKDYYDKYLTTQYMRIIKKD